MTASALAALCCSLLHCNWATNSDTRSSILPAEGKQHENNMLQRKRPAWSMIRLVSTAVGCWALLLFEMEGAPER
jgi:hypothetical protein